MRVCMVRVTVLAPSMCLLHAGVAALPHVGLACVYPTGHTRGTLTIHVSCTVYMNIKSFDTTLYSATQGLHIGMGTIIHITCWHPHLIVMKGYVMEDSGSMHLQSIMLILKNAYKQDFSLGCIYYN